MDEREWEDRLRGGIGGRRLGRLRYKTAVATAIDLIEVGTEMSNATSDISAADATDAVGYLLRMAGELTRAAATMLSKGEHYAGCALLRQITEIEYLTWAIKEKHRNAISWLRSTHEERKKAFTPAQLRKTSKGRFLDKDYQDHCEQGGHPTVRGIFLLGGKNTALGQLLLVDLLLHSWRTWDQAAAWSRESPRASKVVASYGRRISWRLHDWGTQDPIYKLAIERHPDSEHNQRSSLKVRKRDNGGPGLT